MSVGTPKNRAYKDITLQQLRSLCETIRLGSFTASAASLGLAHPTVWNQVHALERRLGVGLVEPHRRGCRPTHAGRLLAQLAGPLVTGLGSLESVFQAAQAADETRLVVSSTPRLLVEDMPECVVEFERRQPHVQLTLQEAQRGKVADAVESAQADLGFTACCEPDPNHPRLTFEPCYELEMRLIAPRDHPLARRRRIRARDLCAYPLVNAPDAFYFPSVAQVLRGLGVFQTQRRHVEAFYIGTIRRYVGLGFGIGLTPCLPSHPPQPNLHERPLCHIFGRLTVYVIRRKGAILPGRERDFIEVVKSLLTTADAQTAR